MKVNGMEENPNERNEQQYIHTYIKARDRKDIE